MSRPMGMQCFESLSSQSVSLCMCVCVTCVWTGLYPRARSDSHTTNEGRSHAVWNSKRYWVLSTIEYCRTFHGFLRQPRVLSLVPTWSARNDVVVVVVNGGRVNRTTSPVQSPLLCFGIIYYTYVNFLFNDNDIIIIVTIIVMMIQRRKLSFSFMVNLQIIL